MNITPKLKRHTGFTLIISCFIVACSDKFHEPEPLKITTPKIVSLSIDSGAYNTPVTITGTGFGKDTASNQVMFNGHKAAISSATTTKIITTVPENAGTGNLTITTGGLTATGPVFKYLQPAVKPDSLYIVSLSPDSGTYNTSVTINGLGFSSTVANNKLLFNGKAAVISAATAMAITATVPQDAGTGRVTIQVNGKSASGPIFKYIIPVIKPVITSLSVSQGLIGTGVVINGTGFSPVINNNKLFFNGQAATITAATPTSLATTVPAGATTGPVTIVVNNNNAQGPVFTVKAPLTIAKLSATTGVYRDAITITGTGYSEDMSAIQVYVNGKKSDVLSSSATQILFGVPLSAGTGVVKVVVNGATINGPVFTYMLSSVADVITLSQPDPSGNTTDFLKVPTGVGVDSLGNIYIGDSGHSAVKKVSAHGSLSTFAGGTAGFQDGKGANAKFYNPANVAADANGNLYVADPYNRAIRKITPDGNVSTVYTGDYQPFAIAADKAGNIYFSGGTTPTLLMKMSTDKKVTVLAGSNTTGFKNGTGNMALFGEILGIAADATGNIYVADAANNLIRKITPAGNVSTLAGTGAAGKANGAALKASFDRPCGVAVDAGGNVYVADYHNWLIRKISAAGQVTTVIGKPTSYTQNIDGNVDFAVIPEPNAIAVDASGLHIYVIERDFSSLRKITIVVE
ncbi:IPT/TIG domain-containing protein [Mucilaginibacter sp. P25]|uniref:NHL repeat-containing protein n=1 Tax=Mucilaginibacter gossypii TaxID=551996 RepID=A0A1G8NNX4_9SPHI|nr:IPT/TIG domain-containing protein [Mucilaginibacter gossypii]SDI81875.1 NHL repeat-containing protein [Mucilaginibacter gossypii]